MPRLDKEFNLNPIGHMRALGLEIAFDMRSDLLGLIQNAYGYPFVFISELRQTVRIRLCAETRQPSLARQKANSR